LRVAALRATTEKNFTNAKPRPEQALRPRRSRHAPTQTTGDPFIWTAGIFALGLLLALLILAWKTPRRGCTLKTALANGIAYAHHHVESTHASATSDAG
jgi:hypothetical protein